MKGTSVIVLKLFIKIKYMDTMLVNKCAKILTLLLFYAIPIFRSPCTKGFNNFFKINKNVLYIYVYTIYLINLLISILDKKI